MENFSFSKRNTVAYNSRTQKPLMNAGFQEINSFSKIKKIQLAKIPVKKLDWLSDGGEIADIIRSRDWSKTALGPIEKWPQSLRTTISLCLASSFPINILWGPDAVQIYNSGFKDLCGGVHPRALGESFRVTWESAWPAIGEPFEKARLGETSYLENQRMFLTRNGYIEETFFTFSLSPIRDESGEVVGLFNPATETTSAALNQRRTRCLRDISSESANSDNVQQAVSRIITTLQDYKFDIPGAFVFLKDETGHFSVAASTPGLEQFMDLSKWPIAEALETSQPFCVDDLISRFSKVSGSEYPEPMRRACLLPIKTSNQNPPVGYVVVFVSTRLPFNDNYMAFLDLLSSSVNLTIANAMANDETNVEISEFQTDINDLKKQRQFQHEKEQMLIESRYTAESATRAKTSFLANMSHEIRTPLAAILGFTDILKSTELEKDEQNKYLNIISRNGNSLVRIIDDILDLTKIEAGRIHLEQDSLCLTELIEDVIGMFSDRAKGKGLNLYFESQNFPDFNVDSDAVRIRQILINLIGNAIKFTSEGSVKIAGNYKIIEADLLEIKICISDTGIGISPEQGAHLFQAFHQADNSTTRHYGGTGLGLALSRKLAIAMGGDISMEESQNSCGTTFMIKLLVKKSFVSLGHDSSNNVVPHDEHEKRLIDWKILIIDDSPDNRFLVRILLEREGAMVSEASGAMAGIKMSLESDFDVVLMDIQMPEVDGYEALTILRNQNYKKPVFALTAHTMKEERDRALAAGFSGHIAKPVNATALIETLLSRTRQTH